MRGSINCDRQNTIMGVKRKHFDDASPTSISSSGFVSTPDTQSPTRFPQGLDGSMDMELDTETTSKTNGWDFSRAQRTKNSDWGLRTRKRVRDNRPDERVIQGMCLSSSAPSQPGMGEKETDRKQRTPFRNSSSHNANHTPLSRPSTKHPLSQSQNRKSQLYTLSGLSP